MIRVLDSADSTLVEWGRQQQQQQLSTTLPTTLLAVAEYGIMIAVFGKK